ncbi:MAG: hypothetical protein P1U56_18220 [Saprospiraceae bacterium]|nr:hypothetical protein [Saprospiraceae bacterium]
MRNTTIFLAFALGLTLISLSCSKDENQFMSDEEIRLRSSDDTPPQACNNCRVFLSMDDECNLTASLTKGCLGNVTYQWTTPNGIENTPTVDASTDGKYCLYIFTDQGCWASACMVVENCEDVCVNDCIDVRFSKKDKCVLVVNLDECDVKPTQIYWTVPMDYIPNGTTVKADTDGVYCAHVTFPDGCQYIECINVKDCKEFCEDNCSIEIDVDDSGIDCVLDVIPTSCSLLLEVEWTLPDGSTTTESSVTATEDGEYCVSVTQPNGCELTECINILNCGGGIDCTDFKLEWVDFEDGEDMFPDEVNSTPYLFVKEYEDVGGTYETNPVAYVAGEGFSISARFTTTCDDLETIFIRGTHTRPDGMILHFSEQEITVATDGAINYNWENAVINGNTFTFPEQVEFHDPFEIEWEYSHDQIDWSLIHTSGNPVYVTRDEWNKVMGNEVKRYHTYFRISCQLADGKSLESEIIDEIWTIFANKSFKRADDQALTYYGNWNTPNFWAEDLILTGDGQCSTHSQAFLNCLKAHGINYNNDYLRIEAYQDGKQLGLLVQNFEGMTTPPGDEWAVDSWAPGGEPTGLPAGFDIEYVVVPKDSWSANTSNSFIDNVHYSEITDLNGLDGQHNDNPKAYFLNHQIVKIGATHYDVPYGTTYGSLDEVKGNMFGYIYVTNAMIDEDILQADANGDMVIGGIVPVEVWLIDRDFDDEVGIVDFPTSSF